MFLMTFFWGTLSAFATAVYLILFKKESKDTLACIFWNYIFLFIIMLCAFYLRNIYAGKTVAAATVLFKDTLFENIPLYIVDATSSILSIIMYAYAFSHYRVSQIIPIVQLGVIFITAGYWILGTPISFIAFIGIFLISLGAILSGFEKFYFPNILKPLTKISRGAYLTGLLIMIFDSLGEIIVYIATYKDYQTSHLDSIFGHMKGIHHFHFAFTNALQYYEASLPWLILGLLLYLLFIKRYSLVGIYDVLKKNTCLIIGLTLANFGNNYIYLYAYQQTTEKSLLVALTQFSIPLTLVLAYLHLKEKVTLPEKVGAVLIVIGGFFGAF